jgi:hypothetical protein
MIHPLAEDFSQLKDTEIENKIQELGRKYFQCSNPAVQHQITLFLDMYKTELAARRARMWQEQYQKRDTDLDSLINVS